MELRANHEIIDYQYNIKDRGTRQVVQGYTDKLQFISENIQNILLLSKFLPGRDSMDNNNTLYNH